MKTYCDRLAQSGFVTFAPDLYHGKVTTSIEGAEALSSALNPDRAKAEVAAAAAFLTRSAGETDRGLAVIGFSLGAFFALDLSTAHPEHLRSVVLYYGTGGADFRNSKAAYLGHFAETDEFEPKQEVDRLEAALRDASRPVSFHTYPGTGHWFAEPDRISAYNQAAASLAWDRTLDFLRGSTDK